MAKRLNTQEFISKARLKHGSLYDYSEVIYDRSCSKVTIICKLHGRFEQIAHKHLSGKGCIKCGYVKQGKSHSKKIALGRKMDFDQPSDHKLIPLSRNKYAIVDNEVFSHVSSINWKYCHGYAYNTSLSMLMHRFIMNLHGDLEADHIIDHINGNTLDNRKSNLRICNRQQNRFNSAPVSGSTSKYKGVSWHKKMGLWRSRITIDAKGIHLGYTTCEIEAAKMYDKAAKEMFGDFAYLNFK